MSEPPSACRAWLERVQALESQLAHMEFVLYRHQIELDRAIRERAASILVIASQQEELRDLRLAYLRLRLQLSRQYAKINALERIVYWGLYNPGNVGRFGMPFFWHGPNPSRPVQETQGPDQAYPRRERQEYGNNDDRDIYYAPPIQETCREEEHFHTLY